MVRKITQYKTKDGTVFSAKAKADKHEKLCDEINAAMKPLGPLPKDGRHKFTDCDFVGGKGYLSHNPSVVLQVRIGLVKIAGRFHGWFKQHKAEDIHSHSVAGRYLSDGGPSVLYTAWSRLMCIDDQGREWGQPYFALNPNKGKQQVFKTKRAQ